MAERRIIRMHETGGPDVLRPETEALAPPGPGELRVRQAAAGLNFIDTYHRSGLYPVKLPFIPGSEGAGEVDAVGEGVEAFKPGDRIAYLASGTYASHVTLKADRALALPDGVDFDTAAAVLLKGLTAWMLLFEVRRAMPGDTALIWAPAGGVGSLLVPWATSLGVAVIAVTSSEEKAERARRLGAAHVIARRTGIAEEVRALTGGRGVDVAYDSVGRASAEETLASLARRGWWVSYGNASGPADPVAPGRLGQLGSLVLTRPGLFDFVADPAALKRGAAALFGALRAGTLEAQIGQRFALEKVADAHRALESGTTIGATLIAP